MRVTEDRLAVARAVQREAAEGGPLPDYELEAIIESLPEPEPLPAPTGPGLWWMFDPRESERGWRGQNVFKETCFSQPQLVIRSPGFEDKPRDGQLWVGPLIAPTAKGGE